MYGKERKKIRKERDKKWKMHLIRKEGKDKKKIDGKESEYIKVNNNLWSLSIIYYHRSSLSILKFLFLSLYRF